MPKLTIDNQQVEVPEGATVLDAARSLGIEIPTLCHSEGRPANTSCFVCVVKVHGRQALAPACATLAADGMVVESECEEVRAARRTALELLLSDHVGDCDAPCQIADDLHIHIPRVLRHVAAGNAAAAMAEIQAACPPGTNAADITGERAEKACRRRQHDAPVAIGAVLRYVLAAAARPPTPKAERKRERGWSVHTGKVSEEEMRQFLAHVSGAPRVAPAGEVFTAEEATAEAARCLHCDCRAAGDCALQRWAEAYGAKPARYRAEQRREVKIAGQPPGVLYEPAKCINCGICIQVAQEHGEPLGLTFIGRGFDVRVGPPMGAELRKALTAAAAEAVRSCPTGALAFDETGEQKPENRSQKSEVRSGDGWNHSQT